MHDLLRLLRDGLAAGAVQHGKQVVGPAGPMTRAAIAMAHARQLGDSGAQIGHLGVIHIPHAHAIGGIAQAIVVPVPHPEFGATPVAFVACSGALDAAKISDALLRVLPRFKVPRHYYPWPDEHADGGMKVSRAALARRAASLQ